MNKALNFILGLFANTTKKENLSTNQISNAKNNFNEVLTSSVKSNFDIAKDEAHNILKNFFEEKLKFDFFKEFEVLTNIENKPILHNYGILETYTQNKVLNSLEVNESISDDLKRFVTLYAAVWMDKEKRHSVSACFLLDKGNKRLKLEISKRVSNRYSVKDAVFSGDRLCQMADCQEVVNKFCAYVNMTLNELELEVQP